MSKRKDAPESASDDDDDPDTLRKKELKKRGMSTTGSSTILANRLKEAKAAEKRDPAEMLVDEIRGHLKARGLDTEGTKAVCQHRLSVEFARVRGENASDFNPEFLSVEQLREWLESRGIKPPGKSAGKPAHVAAVKAAAASEDEKAKKQDIDSMTEKDIKKWLKDNGVSAEKGKDRAYYAKLMKKHVHKDADGVLLFTEDEVIFHKKLLFGQRLVVVQGDISKCAASAVVHPTDEEGAMTGGVGQALDKAAPSIKKKLVKLFKKEGKLEPGHCRVTTGGELPASHVIHTCCPKFDADDEKESVKILTKLIRNILTLAEEEKLESVALPSIGSGANKYPSDLAAETILKAITSFFEHAGAKAHTKQVYFVLFGKSDVDTYKKHAMRL